MFDGLIKVGNGGVEAPTCSSLVPVPHFQGPPMENGRFLALGGMKWTWDLDVPTNDG